MTPFCTKQNIFPYNDLFIQNVTNELNGEALVMPPPPPPEPPAPGAAADLLYDYRNALHPVRPVPGAAAPPPASPGYVPTEVVSPTADPARPSSKEKGAGPSGDMQKHKGSDVLYLFSNKRHGV